MTTVSKTTLRYQKRRRLALERVKMMIDETSKTISEWNLVDIFSSDDIRSFNEFQDAGENLKDHLSVPEDRL